ncbi:SAM-dependent methyltransferase [Protofrankia coriariae]|uniref:Cyclopropane-fatty-acyl-phospholipid synthase n=1 Tax=Protofrankia coriariae TaxID=1562887 RepID=A0ABR5F5X0_9ACTN|nr:cyclopropane-fatty-acyl-phospholipid synthase [Protofrankia coriariae]
MMTITGPRTDTALADTNQHYDLDPEIFGLFLDPSRKYSCGLYRSETDTLADAQINKLRFVAERLGLRGGERLLDVGCGWGSLLLFMAREHACRATGISPAARQHAYISGRARELGVADQVSTWQGHFEEIDLPAGSFDAVTMLGSIVHMPDLTAVFARARALLRRGGTLYVSESCFRNAAAHGAFHRRAGTRFVGETIFGWGDMRPLSDLVRGAEDAGFSIVGLDDLTADYRRTIDDWLTNVRSATDDIERIRPGLTGELERYLEIANAGWGYTTKHYALTCRKTR